MISSQVGLLGQKMDPRPSQVVDHSKVHVCHRETTRNRWRSN